MQNRQQTIEELYETMDVAKRSMHLHMQTVVAGHTISRTQLELLFTIQHTQPTTAKQLAQKLQLTPGAISQLVEELSEQSLIERHIDTADRRRQVIRVSTEGGKLIKAFETRRRDVMERVIKQLSDEELRTWLKIQKQVISEHQALHSQLTTQPKERNKA